MEKKIGAQPGNKNNVKAKIWSDALRRHITQNPKDLVLAAQALLDKAKEGDVAALKELGDRLEGKSMQAVTLSGDSENPLITLLQINSVSTKG